MIKRLLIFFTGIIVATAGQAQWIQEETPTSNNLNSISVFDDNSAWIVGAKGTLLYKEGKDWIEFTKFSDEDLNSVFMINKNDVWATGENGIIIHFNGRKWELADSPTKNDLHSVYFQDSGNGIAVGDLGTILIYKNGSWKQLESGTRDNLFSAHYLKDQIWIGGGLECVNVPLRKLDLCKTENQITYNYYSGITVKSIVLIHPGNGWAAGSPSALLHFNGEEWEKVNNNEDFSSLNSIFFTKDTGISVGFGGTILTYCENLWTKEKANVTEDLNGAAILNNKYIAVGNNGTIVSRDIKSENILTDPKIYPGSIKIYPNPCDEFLSVEIPDENGNKTLPITINNLTGGLIIQKELRLSTINPTFTLVTSDMKNGLYFFKVKIENRIITGKFVVQH